MGLYRGKREEEVLWISLFVLFYCCFFKNNKVLVVDNLILKVFPLLHFEWVLYSLSIGLKIKTLVFLSSGPQKEHRQQHILSLSLSFVCNELCDLTSKQIKKQVVSFCLFEPRNKVTLHDPCWYNRKRKRKEKERMYACCSSYVTVFPFIKGFFFLDFPLSKQSMDLMVLGVFFFFSLHILDAVMHRDRSLLVSL